MEITFLIALVGLVGAVIGSLSSIVTIYVQSKIQDKRERSKIIMQAAIEDYKTSIELAKNIGTGKKAIIQPMIVGIFWYSKVFNLLDQDNLNLKSMKKIVEESDEIEKYFEKFIDE